MCRSKQDRLARRRERVYEKGMTWMRRFKYTFAAFIIIMLLWEAYQYNEKISKVDPLHPTQQHFYFIHTNAHMTVAPPMRNDGPDVQQTNFVVENNTPGNASFTCLVTLKNKGKVKAVNVQVNVRPYRGAKIGSDDVGRTSSKPLDDGSPLAQLGQWVSFPDLASGASDTESAVFTKQTGVNFGNNPTPDIIFEPEKK
jgi:hypothetical protein